eukprot:8785841-Pyramimonas_sp.AAC.1
MCIRDRLRLLELDRLAAGPAVLPHEKQLSQLVDERDAHVMRMEKELDLADTWEKSSARQREKTQELLWGPAR